MAREETRAVPDVCRDSSGDPYLGFCIVGAEKIMRASDSVGGVICTNPGCRGEVPKMLQEMVAELVSMKNDEEETREKVKNMEELLAFIHKNITRKEKKGKEVSGVVELPKSMLDSLDELLLP